MEIQQIADCLESQCIPMSQEQEQQEQGKEEPRKNPKVEKPEMIEIVNLDDDADDGFFYAPISIKGNTKRTAISVEQYSEEMELNLAILASLKPTTKTNKQENFVHLSYGNHDYYYVDDVDGGVDDDIKVLNFRPRSSTSKVGRKRFKNSMSESGQSSKPKRDPEFVCEICFEPKTVDESFNIKGCTHAYCRECMAKYVATKLQDNISNIHCPVSGCSGLLEPEYCRSILPEEVFDRWGNALCEALIIGCQKFYCPFKDCSAMLIDDGGEIIKESECPNCCRMFCAQCKVPWHSGIQCQEFQELHKDEREKEDIMLMRLAENKHWRRCPNCRIYVERTQGCRYMKCRCGAAFCYSCGFAKISSNSHYCNYCKG